MAEVTVQTPPRQFRCEKVSVLEQHTFEDADSASAWGDEAASPGDLAFMWECSAGHVHALVITSVQESLIEESEVTSLLLVNGAMGFIKPGPSPEEMPKW